MLFGKLTNQILNLHRGSTQAKSLGNMWHLFESMILNTTRNGPTAEVVLSRCRKLASNDPMQWKELLDPVLSAARTRGSAFDKSDSSTECKYSKADRKARLGQIKEVGQIIYDDLTGFPTRSEANDQNIRDK